MLVHVLGCSWWACGTCAAAGDVLVTCVQIGADFRAKEVQRRLGLQFLMFLCLCFGAGAMALLAHFEHAYGHHEHDER